MLRINYAKEKMFSPVFKEAQLLSLVKRHGSLNCLEKVNGTQRKGTDSKELVNRILWKWNKGGNHPLLLKILTEFSPILGYAFSRFGVFFRKWRRSFSPILGHFLLFLGKSYREILLKTRMESKKKKKVFTSENLGRR